jgi:SAM-dependent methyltransferase
MVNRARQRRALDGVGTRITKGYGVQSAESRGEAGPADAEEAAGWADVGSVDLVTRRDAAQPESARANRSWWDANADEYQAEHGEYLGDARFLWCPEGVYEDEARLLGDIAGRDVLEVGCGAAQCARWLTDQGAHAVAFDLSARQLQHARRIDQQLGRPALRLVQAEATALPFADASFDVACSAFGAVPFVSDSALLMREVARVLRPGGRWVFSVPHPFRWALPDLPDDEGLVVRHSYFDRRPYVEQDEDGEATYIEHHRTVGDRIRELTAAGLAVRDVVEPEYPDELGDKWGGGWSARRGRLVPGTAIFVTRKVDV